MMYIALLHIVRSGVLHEAPHHLPTNPDSGLLRSLRCPLSLTFCMGPIVMTFINIYLMRRGKGYTVRNAIKDAWRTVRGIY